MLFVRMNDSYLVGSFVLITDGGTLDIIDQGGKACL